MYRRAYKKSKSASRGIPLLFYSRHFAIYVGVAFISILGAVFQVGLEFGLPGFIYVLLGPLCYWHSKLFEKNYPNMSL
jgi:hypothetical protein